ncbi:MAG TPA: hypothetical protein PK402_12555, partial [Tepidisphaeraceae bacterium]|nr:hypothetical protein [Tepidisphaeraceae bacterium]
MNQPVNPPARQTQAIDTSALNRILENFSAIARCAEVTDDYEVWRFDVGEHRYILLYYPDERSRLEKRLTISPAMRQFGRLQAMQSHKFPAPRVIATLKGFRVGGRKGDAVIINGSDRDSTLEQLLLNADLNGSPLNRIDLQARITRALQDLHSAQLVSNPLSLRSFWKRNEELIPGESYGASTGIVNELRLLELGADAERFTTRTERLRLWKHFLKDAKPPTHNPIAHARANELAHKADRGRDAFQLVEM